MIKTKIYEGIGIITLSRPQVHNAINHTIMIQLEQILNEWSCDDRVKVLVITGEGDQAFCSGGDVQEFHQLQGSEVNKVMQHMKRILFQLHNFPKPTVAAINGTAVGGGCEIAVACDFRVAHEHVILGFVQIQLGISTGWGGGTRLFQLLPRGKALELLLSGEKISAKDAFAYGLIDHLFPQEGFMKHVMDWSQRYTKHTLAALMAYKQTALDHDQNITILDRLDREVERFLQLWVSDDHYRAVEDFLQKKSSNNSGQNK